MFGRTMIKGAKGAAGAKGAKGDKGDKGDTGERGLQGVAGSAAASPYLFLVNETASLKTYTLTDADLNKMWILDLPNSGLDIIVPENLLLTVPTPMNPPTGQRLAWVMLMKVDSGSGIARLVRQSTGGLIANLLNNNIQSLYFKKNTNGFMEIAYHTYNSDGSASSYLFV